MRSPGCRRPSLTAAPRCRMFLTRIGPGPWTVESLVTTVKPRPSVPAGSGCRSWVWGSCSPSELEVWGKPSPKTHIGAAMVVCSAELALGSWCGGLPDAQKEMTWLDGTPPETYWE
ncbi:hypothetical protein GOODEAATRI_020725, partial [Goodea atripinnis]